MKKKSNTGIIAVSAVIFLALTAAFCLLLTGGKIEYRIENTSVSAKTLLWKNLSIDLSDIESAQLRDDVDAGTRTNGFGSAKLSMGSFHNDEFGDYTLYRYNKCGTVLVLRLNDGSVTVLGGENSSEAETLYTIICKSIEQTEK